MTSPHDFSSMTALICFEAAARHCSFKLAAEEMNVTPAAISHQIKALEADLNCTLFIRQHRGVDLTDRGFALFQALQRGFGDITEAIGRLRDRPGAVDVTIGATTAFSSLWLTPKISAFWKLHPDVTVSQMVSDVPAPSLRCDLSIHYGSIPTDGSECRVLFQDRIVALGTAGFAAQHGIATLADLNRAPLIHSSAEGTDWTSWQSWFGVLGQQAPRGRRFSVNNYMIALQAAQDEIGAVLGWDGLVGSLMQPDKLVLLVPESIASPYPFHLRIHPRASAKAKHFAEWLVSNV